MIYEFFKTRSGVSGREIEIEIEIVYPLTMRSNYYTV